MNHILNIRNSYIHPVISKYIDRWIPLAYNSIPLVILGLNEAKFDLTWICSILCQKLEINQFFALRALGGEHFFGRGHLLERGRFFEGIHDTHLESQQTRSVSAVSTWAEENQQF